MASPTIEIIDPTLPTTRSADQPTILTGDVDERLVVGRVRAAGDLIALMVNDAEQAVGEDGLFRVRIALEDDETPVRIAAIDERGNKSTLQFLLKRKVIATASRSGDESAVPVLPGIEDVDFGEFHALVIGNNDFKMLPKLETAENDARAVAEVLEKLYGYKVTLLLNANRYDILSNLNRLREDLTDEDNLLIYYAGHGELDRINNRGHWLPVDAESDSTANWISNIQITDVLNAMTVRQVLVVADSCYSGTLTRSSLAQLSTGMSLEMRVNWIKLMAQKRARLVLSSGGVQPVLDGGGGEHSVFARAFLAAIEENEGVLEGQRLYQMVSQKVANVEAAQQIEQVPQYAPIKYAGHAAGDFFFVRNPI